MREMLKQARKAARMNQQQLANRSGVSRSAIAGYETGRNMPGSRELMQLCIVLNVSPSVLLFGKEWGEVTSNGREAAVERAAAALEEAAAALRLAR